ncbi:MAG: HDOD domain-containing protein [Planctomycetes bacterium]|nr:HDOD domain-containing protein [Planctomycetota bacterium]
MTSVAETIFVGRQPIYNQRLDVVAYELLFHDSSKRNISRTDGDVATSKLLINTLLEIGLENLVGDRPAYVNFTRNFLTGDYPLPFDHDRLVVTVLKDVEPDEALMKSLRKLADEGYSLALDEFVLDDRFRSLIEIAEVVKIDYSRLNDVGLRNEIESLQDYPIDLLVENIGTYEEFELSRDLGFDLFQGHFLSQPRIIEQQTIPYNRLAILSLIGKLQDPSIAVEEIEELVTHDVSLSYKLLRYINSAAVGLGRKVESIRHAVVLLGLQRLRAMITLIMLAGIDDKPIALLETAMLRARMCQSLAEELNRNDQDAFFTVGLFSALDALMDRPLQSILEGLPLSDDVKGAILSYEGAMGATLKCVLCYERGEWDAVQCLNLEPSTIREAFLQSASWLKNTQDLLASEAVASR